jgi:hypothetical protein
MSKAVGRLGAPALEAQPVQPKSRGTSFKIRPRDREPALPQFVSDLELAERWLLDEWRQMWQQCPKTTDLRARTDIVRFTSNGGTSSIGSSVPQAHIALAHVAAVMEWR